MELGRLNLWQGAQPIAFEALRIRAFEFGRRSDVAALPTRPDRLWRDDAARATAVRRPDRVARGPVSLSVALPCLRGGNRYDRADHIVFTTRQEAKRSCLAVRSAGSGRSGHTSRHRTHQSPHARYPPRNLGRSGGTARVRRGKELRCAERGPTPTTNFRAPRTNPASGLDEACRRDRGAAPSRQDQLDRENDGG
jgi:hypothetical protein